jgi:hypothetical protein
MLVESADEKDEEFEEVRKTGRQRDLGRADTSKAAGLRMALTLRGKIALILIGLAAFIAVLEESWRPVDRYFPKLNKYLHSGTPSTQSDLEYLVAHFGSDAYRLNKLCLPDNPPALRSVEEAVVFVKDCRAQMLAAKPVLDDLHVRFQQLKAAEAQETAQQSVPPECTNVVERVNRSFESYLALEDRTFAEWQSIDLDLTDPHSAKAKGVGEALRRLAGLEQGGAAATLDELKGIDEKLIRDACTAR